MQYVPLRAYVHDDDDDNDDDDDDDDDDLALAQFPLNLARGHKTG